MLTWSPVFETKIELIDSQHQTLFDMVNALTTSALHGDENNEDELNHALDELLAYAQQHFSDEELVMTRYKLDEKYLSLQRMEHKSFIYDITRMRDHLSPDDDLSERFDKLAQFVTSWLVYHTLRIDLLITKQIMVIKAGKTPAEAYEWAKHSPCDPEINKLVLNAVLHLWEDANKRIHELEEKLAAAQMQTTHCQKL